MLTPATQRWVVLGLVFATTVAATVKLFAIFRIDGLSALEWLVLGVFAVLFSWIAASFWVACFGAYELWKGAGHKPLADRVSQAGIAHSRTALAVPIYNEDCAAVFAGIETMRKRCARSARFIGSIFSCLAIPATPIAAQMRREPGTACVAPIPMLAFIIEIAAGTSAARVATSLISV